MDVRVALATREDPVPRMIDGDLREPRGSEVLVEIRASGVCATDLLGLDTSALGDAAVYGHEGAGIVIAVGADVTSLTVGDRVVLGFDSCGECEACIDGVSGACARFARLNSRGVSGRLHVAGKDVATGWMGQSAWASHVLVSERACVRIGADVPAPVAATLGCGVLTGAGTVMNVLQPGREDSLAVFGAGTTGLAAVMMAAHRGVGRILVVEPSPHRRALALRLGAHEAVESGMIGADEFTHALDTVGTTQSLVAAMDALAVRGTAVTVALRAGVNPVELSQSRLLWNRGVRGVIEGGADIASVIPVLADLWRIGRLPVGELVSVFDTADIDQAVTALRERRAVKPVLTRDAVGDVPRTPDLRAALLAGDVEQATLTSLWRSLPGVRSHDLRGFWRGAALTDDHAVSAMLDRLGWMGKLFVSDEDVAPLVCDRGAGLEVDVRAARGGAVLRAQRHLGVETTAMIYDGMPIIDLFVRVDDRTVLGVMTGSGLGPAQVPFFFLLQKDDAAVVVRQ